MSLKVIDVVEAVSFRFLFDFVLCSFQHILDCSRLHYANSKLLKVVEIVSNCFRMFCVRLNLR